VNDFLGTDIFWGTVVSLAIVLSLATFLGRAVCVLLPAPFRGTGKFYLSPVLGLAALALLAGVLGHFVPLGNSVWVPLGITTLLLSAFCLERNIATAFQHALVVSLFGIACGASMLAPLYVYGGFDSSNDAFTYLAHAAWLQDHAFSEQIAADATTPFSSQIYLYQRTGLRMGASFLLGMLQALLNLRFAYDVYPSLALSAIASCCLSAGFPIARLLRSIARPARLALLALPAFTAGGLVLGAAEGFLPQTLGLAFGAAVVFTSGPLLAWAATTRAEWRAQALAPLPLALLLASMVYAYPELAPFIGLAICLSVCYAAIRYRRWRGLLIFCAVCVASAGLILNTELARAYAAIRMQSGAVVGNAVDWPALGFLAHALGLYGGDTEQPFPGGSRAAAMIPLGLLGISLCILGLARAWKSVRDGRLMPVMTLLAILAVAFAYFRYEIPSPFALGMGQSWSQYKLSEWMHPFAMSIAVAMVAGLKARSSRRFARALMGAFLVGLIIASSNGIRRVAPVSAHLGAAADLSAYYIDFRKTVARVCAGTTRVYLALPVKDLKFRQMAALYLHDRAIASDWSDDPYVVNWLPAEEARAKLREGDCVVESAGARGWLAESTLIGPYQVGAGPLLGKIDLGSVSGAHVRESDGISWWHWVAHEIDVKLNPQFIPSGVRKTRIKFEYATTTGQNLTLRVRGVEGQLLEIPLGANGFPPVLFDEVVEVPPSGLVELSIRSEAPGAPLSQSDQRLAAFIVRNLEVVPVRD